MPHVKSIVHEIVMHIHSAEYANSLSIYVIIEINPRGDR